MSTKKFVQFFLVTVIVLASFVNVSQAFAWGGCSGSYTVQWGDTLGTIAANNGTTVAALRAANPNLGYWLYAGQTITLPGSANCNNYGNNYGNNDGCSSGYGYGCNNDYRYDNNSGNNNYGNNYGNNNGYENATWNNGSSCTYVVQWGDTMRIIANRMGLNLNDLIAANPQLWNPNLIFAGQVIHLPCGGSTYGASYGQSYGSSNYGGQSNYGGSSTYTVCRGDTLKIIASRFGTTVGNLLSLNPQIWNPDWIYAGMVIRIY